VSICFYFSYSIFDTAPNKQPFHIHALVYTNKIKKKRNDTGAYEKFIYYTSLTFFQIFIRVYDHLGKQNKDKLFLFLFSYFFNQTSMRAHIYILFVLMHKFACDTISLCTYLSFYIDILFHLNRVWVIPCKELTV
jgi:hypothetical protein